MSTTPPTPNPPPPPTATLLGPRRYIGIYAILVRNALVREMTFQLNFLLWIAVELLWFGLQLAFFQVIYLYTDSIAGWSKWQVVLLIGASQFIQQIFQALFLVNCTHISELVRTGKLDFLLVLPVNSRFILSVRQLDLGAFVNAGTAIAVMAFAAWQLELQPTAAQLLGFTLLALAGVLIHYSLMFLLATISFWTVQAQGIVWTYYNLFNVARLPDAAFHGLFKVFFSYAVPMLLVANVPVKMLTERLDSPWEIAILLLMTLLCLAISELGWRFAVRRYTSASS
jgi:ABC-2 type transport system permease protein